MAKTFFESGAFHTIMALAVLATLLISILSLVNVYQLKKFIIPKPLDIDDFLAKLNAHQEMQGYADVKPLNVVQITNSNLQGLQSQIRDLDVSFLGNFLVQYDNRIVVYDYLNDTVKGVVSLQPALPEDFFTKLNKHAEMRNLRDQQPISGGIIDEQSLLQLKQQSADFKNAKAGDYILVYSDTAVVYDYIRDRIVATSKIPNQ